MWVTQLEGLGRGEVLFDVGTWHMLLRLGSGYCAVAQSLSRLVELVARTLMVSFTVISFRQNPHYVLRYFICSTYLNIDLSVPKATYIVMMCTHTHTYSPHPLILTHTPHVYTHTHTHTPHTNRAGWFVRTRLAAIAPGSPPLYLKTPLQSVPPVMGSSEKR